jgi:DNA repair ATPase RecN
MSKFEVSNYKVGLETLDFDSIRQLALEIRKQQLNWSDLGSRFRLYNYFIKSGATEDKIESFIDNISSSNIPPEKVIELVNQLFNISKSESIPLDQEIKDANDILQNKNGTIETINEYLKLKEELDKYGISTQDIDKLLNLLVNAKEYGFDGKKIVGKLRKIKRLKNKEEKLKHHCEILSEQVKECNNVLPLAQKIRAMNIDIKELMVFDTAVNQVAKQYNLPPSVAASRLLNEIRDYDKIGGMKREISRLCQQLIMVDGICTNRNKSVMAMLNLQSRGITEDRILYLNNFLENNGYNIDMKSSSN